MAKHLTKRYIEAILNIIYAHDDGKLTWEGLCKAAEPIVAKKTYPSSLSANESVREAYRRLLS